MSKYTDEELEEFLASGDAQKNEDGSVTWAVDNSLEKKPGTWLVRPPQAAPLISTETGTDMARLRYEKRMQSLESAMAVGIGNVLGVPLTSDEAFEAMMAKFAEQGMDINRKDYTRIIKIFMDAFGLSQPKVKVEVDRREQKIEISASEVKILQQSPAIQRLVSDNND